MPSICTQTRTRTEACSCGDCAHGTSPHDKHRINKRDVLALVDLIAGCVDNHPRQPAGGATWAHVGDIASLRRRLMEIAVGFALGPSHDEDVARRHLEAALCSPDAEVSEALIAAVINER